MAQSRVGWSLRKFELFITSLGENFDRFNGMCNGRAFCYFRADLVGQIDKMEARWEKFMRMNDEEIKSLAAFYKRYKEENLNNRELYTNEESEAIAFAEEIYYYIHTVVGAHDIGEHLRLHANNRLVLQNDYNELLKIFSVDGFPNLQVVNVFEIALNFTQQELNELFASRNLFYHDDSVMINLPHHVAYLNKKNDVLTFYNPAPRRFYPNSKMTLADKIVFDIRKKIAASIKYFPVVITIYNQIGKENKLPRLDRVRFIEACFNKRIIKFYNQKAFNGLTNSYLAAKFGHLDVLAFLNQFNLNLFRPSLHLHTSLHVACYFGQVPAINFLLAQPNAPLNQVSLSGNSPLIIAVRQDNVEVVRILNDANADVDIVNQDGNSAVSIAMANNQLTIVQMLLPRSNLPNIQKILFAAIKSGNLAIVTLLCLWCNEKNININTSADNEDNSVLHLAVSQFPNYEIVKVLIKFGANANLPNIDGVTPLRLDSNQFIKRARLELSPPRYAQNNLFLTDTTNRPEKRKVDDTFKMPSPKKVKVL